MKAEEFYWARLQTFAIVDKEEAGRGSKKVPVELLFATCSSLHTLYHKHTLTP